MIIYFGLRAYFIDNNQGLYSKQMQVIKVKKMANKQGYVL